MEPHHLGADFSEYVTLNISDQCIVHVYAIRSDGPTVSRAQILVDLVNFANATVLYIALSCSI